MNIQLLSITTFLDTLFQSGFIVFLASMLLTLSTYHLVLYFQHRDKSYLYYSLYTFIIFTYTFHRDTNFFVTKWFANYPEFLDYLWLPPQYLFHTIYLLFVITFLDFKTHLPKWDKVLKIIIKAFLVLTFVLTAHSLYIGNKDLLLTALHVFVIPVISLVGITILFVVIKKIESKLKYYILIGGTAYLILGLTASFTENMGIANIMFLYFGIMIEIFFFALGLGAKQKKILQDKNLAQLDVIKEHQEKIELQQKIKTKLNKEVKAKTTEILMLTKNKLASEYSKRTLELRMRALQTQMNPHFLFNSLNTVKLFIIKEKKDDALYFLQKIAKLLRKILENSQLQQTSLKNELDIMKLYIEAENIRFKDNVECQQIIDSKINTNDIQIPPLVLQPFVENAIWHGLSLKKGDKKITLKVTLANQILQISIKDNGIGREKAAKIKDNRVAKKESLGIELTKQRLEAFAEKAYHSEVAIVFTDLYENNQPTGTQVNISIPLPSIPKKRKLTIANFQT